jgi:hypothetical protein
VECNAKTHRYLVAVGIEVGYRDSRPSADPHFAHTKVLKKLAW